MKTYNFLENFEVNDPEISFKISDGIKRYRQGFFRIKTDKPVTIELKQKRHEFLFAGILDNKRLSDNDYTTKFCKAFNAAEIDLSKGESALLFCEKNHLTPIAAPLNDFDIVEKYAKRINRWNLIADSFMYGMSCDLEKLFHKLTAILPVNSHINFIETSSYVWNERQYQHLAIFAEQLKFRGINFSAFGVDCNMFDLDPTTIMETDEHSGAFYVKYNKLNPLLFWNIFDAMQKLQCKVFPHNIIIHNEEFTKNEPADFIEKATKYMVHAWLAHSAVDCVVFGDTYNFLNSAGAKVLQQLANSNIIVESDQSFRAFYGSYDVTIDSNTQELILTQGHNYIEEIIEL